MSAAFVLFVAVVLLFHLLVVFLPVVALHVLNGFNVVCNFGVRVLDVVSVWLVVVALVFGVFWVVLEWFVATACVFRMWR